MYDIVVIGAGISGCCGAYFFNRAGLKTLLIDKSGVASTGGSYPAGAFISPKIGKNSPLLELTAEAFEFSKDFYLKNFPKEYIKSGLIRLPRDSKDALKFEEYFKNSQKHIVELIGKEKLREYGVKNDEVGILFREAGFTSPQKLTKALIKDIEYLQHEVKSLEYRENRWIIDNKISSKRVVLATGYESNLLDLRYMGIKGLWGSRGDYKTNLNLKVSIHKKISISANIGGVIRVGATHNRAKEPCMICDGNPLKSLEKEAKSMVDSSDFRLKEIFCGMRSSSRDHFPLVGEIIDSEFMLENYPKIVCGAKAPLKKLPNIYILNGVGGRGFLFSPYLAKQLTNYILNRTPIDSRVNPDRLFFNWCRRYV